jgi:arylsulfatase
VDLPGNDGKTGTQYSHDQFDNEALGFIRQNKDKPFFLYFAAALPHVSMQIPEADLAAYAGKFEETPYDGKKGYMAHPTPRAAYAAMISKFDASVGKVRALLEELKLADNTLIIVTSDNGATHDVGGVETKFFNSAAGLRGLKGSLFEGGIREPFIARWPGKIAPGRVVEEPAVAYDLFATFSFVAGVEKTPANDGVDLSGLLLGKTAKRPADYLLWEFHGYGGQLALRMGEWKAVRENLDNKPGNPVLLYDIAKDPSETTNVAAEHPEIVAKAQDLWKAQHTPNTLFTFPPLDPAPVKVN